MGRGYPYDRKEASSDRDCSARFEGVLDVTRVNYQASHLRLAAVDKWRREHRVWAFARMLGFSVGGSGKLGGGVDGWMDGLGRV